MRLTEDKGFMGSQWQANELAHNQDMNFLHESAYHNATDILTLLTYSDDEATNKVLKGLDLVFSASMTTTLQPGAALSYEGRYYTSGVWGYTGAAGSVFSVVVPQDTSVAFNIGGAQDRIDLVEVRPVRTAYDSKTREFRDPVTLAVTSALVNTKYAYGFEFQIVQGVEGASPVAPTKTAGWIKIAEVEVDAGISTLTQADIHNVDESASWTTEASDTVTARMNIDVINEHTADGGVTIDGVLLKDSDVEADEARADIISEKTTDAGVTMEGILIKDNAIEGVRYVNSQADWDASFYRNSANQYYLNDDITQLHIGYLSAGYDALTNILSVGDTWGELFTNNCVGITMERGTFIQFKTGANEVQGSLQVDTDFCHVKGVHIKGTGSTAAGVTECFELAADHVIFENCIASNRLSNVEFAGFRGSATASHNQTSRYVNCTVFTLDTTGAVFLYGFLDTDNVRGAVVYDLDGSDEVYGMRNCEWLSDCRVEDIDSSGGTVYGYRYCLNGTNLEARDLEAAVNLSVRGFDNCDRLSNCVAIQFDVTGTGNIIGYQSCDELSNCRAEDFDSVDSYVVGFYSSYLWTSCQAYDLESANGNATGFSFGNGMSACQAYRIKTNGAANAAAGFTNSRRFSGCYAWFIENTNTGNANGFDSCTEMTGCEAATVTSTGGTARGINNCDYISAFRNTAGGAASNTFQDDAGNQYSCDNI